MRLISVGIDGYRRFAPKSEMNVDGRVVAIVGPNEAGKTSILQALERLNDDQPIAGGDLTRGASHTGPLIWARYRLDSNDLEAVAGIHDTAKVRWLDVEKHESGEVTGYLRPEPSRDLGPRRDARKNLLRAAEHRSIRAAEAALESDDPAEDEGTESLALRMRSLADELDSAEEDLPSGVCLAAHSLARSLSGLQLDGAPKYIVGLSDQVDDLALHEEADHPHEQAVEALLPLRPQFLLFRERERNLSSYYNLAELDEESPALHNFAKLAGLNIVQAQETAKRGDHGVLEGLAEAANTRLRGSFNQAWPQPDVAPHIRLDSNEPPSLILRILVSAPSGGYTDISEHSDGLRWFISLLAYTTVNPTSIKPVLLVDEAESHLHYDAQADLVRVFSRQETVAKIIYTTHSAGCLPQDLGAGVRVVVPDVESGTSKMKNAFWTEGRTGGFSPLLIGMGASVLAFTPTRFAVIAEGPTEMILLPSLLREVTGIDDLRFQVAPGGAEVAPAIIPSLDLEAACVAYLVDSDEGGKRLAEKYRAADVPAKLIIRLGASWKSGLTLEDMLDANIYAHALNEELARYQDTDVKIPPSAIPNKGRPSAVEAWLAAKGLNAPSKPAVAYRILDLIAEGKKVVAANRREMLVRVYDQLADALRLDELAAP